MINRNKEVEMKLEKVERARQLLNVLEMREPSGRIENLMRLLCIQELSRREQVVEVRR